MEGERKADADALFSALGKYSQGVSCLYLNKLADVDVGVLEQLVATPAFHRWHHQDLGPGGRWHANYAALLPVLDRLFGTLHLPQHDWPQRYGTGEPPLPTLVDQLMGPFMGAAPGPKAGAD